VKYKHNYFAFKKNILIGLGIYFWLIVFSHWREMPEERATDAADYENSSL